VPCNSSHLLLTGRIFNWLEIVPGLRPTRKGSCLKLELMSSDVRGFRRRPNASLFLSRGVARFHTNPSNRFNPRRPRRTAHALDGGIETARKAVASPFPHDVEGVRVMRQKRNGHTRALVPRPVLRPVHRCSTDDLLRLQGFDVLAKVRHPLLHLSLVSTTHTPKQRSPHRHLLGSMRGKSGFVADGGRDFQRGILPSVVLGQ